MSESVSAFSSLSSEQDPPLGALVLSLAGNPQQHSAAAKAFHFQWGRVEKLRAQLAELEALQLEFVPLFDRTLSPLRAQHRQAMREAVLWIDQRLQRKGLGAAQRQMATEALCYMARPLADAKVPDMAALHDRYSRESLAQLAQNEWTLLRDLVQKATGQVPPEGLDRESAEQFMKAHAAHRQKIQQEKQAAREAAQAKKQAKKKPSSATLLAEQLQQNAAGLLRQMFRQLASALHPDRETNEALRLQKTALMSQANAAYDRKDLVALMHLQVQSALMAPGAAAPLADEKLAALTILLKQQVASLERERAQKQQTLMHELNLPLGLRVSRMDILQVLQGLESGLRALSASLDEERSAWDRSDAAFKRWLRTH